MNAAKDDEDYWNSSEKRSFCFESNEVSFYISKHIIFETRKQIEYILFTAM